MQVFHLALAELRRGIAAEAVQRTCDINGYYLVLPEQHVAVPVFQILIETLFARQQRRAEGAAGQAWRIPFAPSSAQ